MSKRLSQEYIYNYFHEYGYELLCEYKYNKQRLKLKCPKGHITQKLTYDSFRRGNCRCPECKPRFKYSYEDFKKALEKEGYKLISPSSEYVNVGSKLKTMCPKGHEYIVSFGHFLGGNRCTKCKLISKGERVINNYLNGKNIEFEEQYRFHDCKFKNTLAFDFYLPQHNCCIEYDGEQHYKINDYFGGLNGFINTKIRDTIKTKYCEDNNIKLIRIPYWDYDNIEKILNEKLNQE